MVPATRLLGVSSGAAYRAWASRALVGPSSTLEPHRGQLGVMTVHSQEVDTRICVDPADLGFNPSLAQRPVDGGPADDPDQRFKVAAKRLRVEIPQLLDPRLISKDLLSPDVEFIDRTVGLAVQGRIKHDLLLGAFAAGAKLSLESPQLQVLRYNACSTTRVITCRWQVVGVPRVPLPFTGYYDRLSTFEVSGNGRVTCHLVDRISPTNESAQRSLVDHLYGSTLSLMRPAITATAHHARITASQKF